MDFLVSPGSPDSVDEFVYKLEEMLKKGDQLKITIKKFEHKTSSQRSLVHIWFRVFAAHKWNCKMSDLNSKQRKRIKNDFKRMAYAQNHWDFILEPVTDVFTGQQGRELRSIEEYDKGELFMFMEWMQSYAAIEGVVLEARGEFKELKEQTNA